jgi:hypothetical protein
MSLIDTVLGENPDVNRMLIQNAQETLSRAMEELHDYPKSKEIAFLAEAVLCVRKLLAL